MAIHRLTRHQAWRVQKIQEERRARVDRKTAQAEKVIGGRRLGPEQEGLVITNHGGNLAVEDGVGRVHHCYPRRHLELPVSGDRVVWQETPDASGVVVALLPRQSLLGRPDAHGRLRPLAANVDRMVVVTAPRPYLSEHLIDRYLVAAETLGIPALIVLNKADLLDSQDTQVRERLALYESIGYAVCPASTCLPDGLTTVEDHLRGHVSVLLGQSGVGKSSIVNHLLPEHEDVAVGELSSTTGYGRHTTTDTTLYHLPRGGDLIDSPGVRKFSLWHLPPQEVAWGFLELRPFLGNCRYRDCAHHEEPGCALRAAVASGIIHPRRLESYHRIVESQPPL
ncbi:Small ribosomal subunit biogenesis GTPase RsgA [Gammaproteobacteria bacterium]